MYWYELLGALIAVGVVARFVLSSAVNRKFKRDAKANWDRRKKAGWLVARYPDEADFESNLDREIRWVAPRLPGTPGDLTNPIQVEKHQVGRWSSEATFVLIVLPLACAFLLALVLGLVR